MGRRGPAPKPTRLKKLEGTYRKDRAPKNEPMPKGPVPECPADLDGLARETWVKYSEILGPLGLLTRADEEAFRSFCESVALYRDACELIERDGMTHKTDTGYLQRHPAVSIRDSALREMKAFMTEFGMTPASRSRISVEPPKPEKRNEWEDIAPGQLKAVK